MGAELSDEEFLIFMTQDAVPQDQYLIEKLMEPFQDSKVGASYARQLPDKDCRMVECYTRSFNYPQESRIKRLRMWINLELRRSSVQMYVPLIKSQFIKNWGDLYRGRSLMKI